MTGKQTIMVNRVHYPVRTLGPGRRAGVWFQRCTIGCGGCASRDTWADDQQRHVGIDEVLRWLDGLPQVDGVTLTGGEPSQQPDGLVALVRQIDAWRRRGAKNVDILLYSGYQLSVLRRKACWPAMEGIVDAVIAGPYVERRNPGGLWRGSANQKLLPLTELGWRRYRDALDRPADRRLQVSTSGDHMWIVGIPGRHTLADLDAGLAASDIRGGRASWRP